MAGMCRVPDGMSSVVIWSMRQSRKTRSITAGPISFGTAAADRQARSRNCPPRAEHPPGLPRIPDMVSGIDVVEAATIDEQVGAGIAKRQREHVGAQERDAGMGGGSGTHGSSGQIDTDRRSARRGEETGFCPQPAAQVDSHPGRPEPAVFASCQQLRRGIRQVPPAAGAIQIGITHTGILPDATAHRDPAVHPHGWRVGRVCDGRGWELLTRINS